MKKLSTQQQNALMMLNNAIYSLSEAWDDELGEVLEDLGYLPERDLDEMNGELDFFLKLGAIGDRQELLTLESDTTIDNSIVTNEPDEDQIHVRLENLDQEDVSYVREVLSNLIDAKHYTDLASDKTLQLPGEKGEQIGGFISEIYSQLERAESTLIHTYPQAVD